MKKKIVSKGTWGGKRERKVKKEPTKVMRIRLSKVEEVEKILRDTNIKPK